METAGVDDMPEDSEHKGIGTPATRATILEKLLETKLVERTGERRKRVLIPTTKGKALASVLPERLCSPQLTADWEQRL
jgi:DNA topoisomerase-3